MATSSRYVAAGNPPSSHPIVDIYSLDLSEDHCTLELGLGSSQLGEGAHFDELGHSMVFYDHPDPYSQRSTLFLTGRRGTLHFVTGIDIARSKRDTSHYECSVRNSNNPYHYLLSFEMPASSDSESM